MRGLATAAERSLSSAIAFLLSARTTPAVASCRTASPAAWREFIAFGVQSDEWVTGYAGDALAHTGQPHAVEAARHAWDWLSARHHEHGPGFGFNGRTPQDADSTLWGCRLACSLGKSSDESSTAALQLILKCAQLDGGIASYTVEDLEPLSRHTGGAVAGWTSSHQCVTAGAAFLPEICRTLDVRGYLANTQYPDGSWRSYWWQDHEYATAFAVESLATEAEYRDVVSRASAWLANSIHRHSPFVVALRLLGIAAARIQTIEPLLQQLLDFQLQDGSWPPSTRLRIPPPWLRNPEGWWNWDEQTDGIGSLIKDRFRIFTTATAVRALATCLLH